MAAAVLVLGAVLGVWSWRTARTAQTPAVATAPLAQRNLTRLTFGPGLQTDVTWSPDGTRIAYAADRNGNFDIWSQPIGGGDPVQITKSPAADTQPSWSPDGRNIVFRSERDGGGLFVVPALGGPERQLSSFGAHPRWSSDGAEILFHVAMPGGLATCTVFHPREESRRVKFCRISCWRHWNWIAFHPDGRMSPSAHTGSVDSGSSPCREGGHVTTSSIALDSQWQVGR